MAKVSSRIKERASRQLRALHQDSEQEIALVIKDAATRLPDEAHHPNFSFRIRMLWGRGIEADDYESAWRQWQKRLPDRYADYVKEHLWQENVTAQGTVNERGLDALARLLIAVRNRQKLLED